ncbi:hypothetical protein Trydic_g1283 [Trypoxylus dichotomus]
MIRRFCVPQTKKDPRTILRRKISVAVKYLSIRKELHRNIIKTGTKSLYGLPKINKDGSPNSPIASAMRPAMHCLAKYPAKNPQPLVGETETCIKNSIHIIEKIKNVKVGKKDVLVNFDVTACARDIDKYFHGDIKDIASSELKPKYSTTFLTYGCIELTHYRNLWNTPINSTVKYNLLWNLN